MKIRQIGLLVALTGCGVAPAGTDSPTADNPQDAGNRGSEFLSIALATEAELPECNPGREKQLVYIEETGEFQTCRGGSWKVIQVGGQKQGAAGADGAPALVETSEADAADCPAGGKLVKAGRDGDGDGALADEEVLEEFTLCNGEDGAEGPEGEQGEPAGVNQFWTSPDTDKRWIKAGIKTSETAAPTRCAGTGWTIPHTTEVQDAMNLGMYTDLDGDAAAGFVLAWKDDESGYERVSNVNTAVSAFATAGNDEAWVFCVEQ